MRRGLLLICLILACAATMALAGDTLAPSKAPTAAAPLTPEMRYANVQRAMQENGIGFKVGLTLGDDGRVLARIEPFDTTAK